MSDMAGHMQVFEAKGSRGWAQDEGRYGSEAERVWEDLYSHNHGEA